MAKRKLPSEKKNYKLHKSRLKKYNKAVNVIINEIARSLCSKVDFEGDITDKEKVLEYVSQLIKGNKKDFARAYVTSLAKTINIGSSTEWELSEKNVDDLIVAIANNKTLETPKWMGNYLVHNEKARDAFLNRVDENGGIISKLQKQSNYLSTLLGESIASAIAKGTSAVALAKQVEDYLNNVDKLRGDYHTYIGNDGKAIDVKYTAMRLARTEINSAYKLAEETRYRNLDFVVGYEVHRSGDLDVNENGDKPLKHECDLCESLKGKYPKDFVFTNWHPNCYSDDTYVLTHRGWKLFADVLDDDLIYSLNPESKTPEYTSFVARQKYHIKDEMIRFYNLSTDMLVTKDHRMVYLNKVDKKISFCSATDFSCSKGYIYKSSLYESIDIPFIAIGDKQYNFDLFCEFMGYWLSDGSTIRKSQILISQKTSEKAHPFILRCLQRLFPCVHIDTDHLSVYDSELCSYLKQFRTCEYKYVPNEIKNASKRQIQIFLDAFIKCDGSLRKAKKFVGNRGGVCNNAHDERLYFTTSKMLCADLCDLIIKIGHRPSIKKQLPKVATKKDGSIIKSKFILYKINECFSVSASEFKKEYVDYDGYVYDLTLAKNHIMLVCRNGKVSWGSNCLCYITPILNTSDEFWSWDGRGEPPRSVNEVTEPPQGFKDYVESMEDSVNPKKTPYFIRNNLAFVASLSGEENKQRVSDLALHLLNK